MTTPGSCFVALDLEEPIRQSYDLGSLQRQMYIALPQDRVRVLNKPANFISGVCF